MILRIAILAVALAFTDGAHARSLEDALAGQLIRARTARAVQRLRRRFTLAVEARSVCAIQVERGSAPLACYEVLDLEREWKILDGAHVRANLRRLDAACAAAAIRLEVSDRSDSFPFVSRECRRRVREARAIRNYRRGDRGWSGD